MLERLARRLEIRTAEIRGETPQPDDDPTEAAAGSDASSVATAARADALAPPPNDHTPAWGRLAELSARFDGTLRPSTDEAIADPDAVNPDGVDAATSGMVDAVKVDVVEVGVVAEEQIGDRRGSDDDLFTPHGDLGTVSLYDAIRQTEDEQAGDAPADDEHDGDSAELEFVIADGDQAIQLPLGLDDGPSAREASDDAPEDHAIPDDTPAVGTVVEESDGSTEMVLSQAAERLISPSLDAALPELDATDATVDEIEPAELTDLAESAHEDEARPTPDIDVFDLIVADRATDDDDSDAAQPLPVHSAHALTSAGPYHDPTFPPRPSASSDSFAEPDEATDDDAVPHGPRWYRKRIEQFGVVMGLVPMVILGGAAALMIAVRAGAATGQIGLWLGTSAAPGLLIAGAPFGSSASYPYAAVGSIPLWLVLGWIARRRTLRLAVADWRDYALQLSWLTLAVIAGAALALTIAAIRLGGPLLG